jgi:octaprenyl-diphosphate synthase
MCKNKTGCLARMAAEIGAELGSENSLEHYVKRLGEIAENLGVAFQILDDVKNLTTGNPGKRKGDDIVEGKKSLPVILFNKYNPNSINKLIELFNAASEKSNKDIYINDAIELLSESGSIAKAKNYAISLLEQINIDIDKYFKGSEPSILLKDLLLSLLK